jgi:hypothetical protein
MLCLALPAKDVEVMSFFCPVRIRDSEQLPVAVVGQSGVCSVQCAVCVVRTSSTTHDRAHGAEAVVLGRGRGEQRSTRQTRTQWHTDDIHDSHDTAKANLKDYGARRPDDD